MQYCYYKKSEYRKLSNENKKKLHRICEGSRQKSGTSADNKDDVNILALEENNIALEDKIAAMESKQRGRQYGYPQGRRRVRGRQQYRIFSIDMSTHVQEVKDLTQARHCDDQWRGYGKQ